jgi:glycosyltransferase involved in cell wall biosynthesis
VLRFRGWLIRDLIAAGQRVVVCGPDQPRLAEGIAGLNAEYVPLPLDRTGIDPTRDAADVLRLRRVIRRVRGRLVLSHSTKPNFIGPIAARLAGVRSVFAMIEGLGYAFTPGGGWKRRLLRTAVTRLLRISLRRCSAVFVLNATDERFVRTAGLVSAGQRVVRIEGTGIDLAEYAAAPVPPGRASFLLIARLLREKGIGEYLEAARRLRQRGLDCRCALLGPVDSNPGALPIEQVAAWQQEGVIDYLGETDDVRPFLRLCTTYVLPSYREGLPRTVMEAMSIGRAIVTTDVPGCRDTTIDGVNGFVVPPRDPEALADAMQRFIDDASLADRLGRASRTLAEQHFDVGRVNSVIMHTMGLGSG